MPITKNTPAALGCLFTTVLSSNMIARPCDWEQLFGCENRSCGRGRDPHPTRKSRNGYVQYSALRFTVCENLGNRATNFPFLVKQDWFRKPIWKELESVAFPYLLVNVYHPVQYSPRAIFIFGGAERKTIRIHPSSAAVLLPLVALAPHLLSVSS